MFFRLRSILVLLLISLSAYFLLQDCSPANRKEVGYLNLNDTVGYVGMQQCRSCHENIYQSYIKTGMGQSFGQASSHRSGAEFGEGKLLYDSIKNLYYKPFIKNDSLYLAEYRLRGNDTVHWRVERIDYIIGSGQHTNSHMCSFKAYVYQAPATFYTQKSRWDLPPGFEDGMNSRFSRPIEVECMSCHNALPEMHEGSLNKYTSIPGGIDCERCHGPGELHVKQKLAGIIVDTSKYIDYTIVNPANLSREKQMSVCQRCHLQGITILEEGNTFYDFKPAMDLSEIMNVFIPRFQGNDENFIMASHADRLKLSKCYKMSDMSCITCHNPHISVKLTGVEVFNNKCRNCHSGANDCDLELQLRIDENENNCVNCHMPASGSVDIPHVQIHDHYIRVSPQKDMTDEVDRLSEFVTLACITQDSPDKLTKAKAYLAYFEKFSGGDEFLLDSAHFYLDKLKLKETHDTYIHYFFLRNDLDKLLEIGNEMKESTELKDPWNYYRISEAYNTNANHEKALKYLERSLQIYPEQLDFLNKKGGLLLKLDRPEDALDVFYYILKLHPKYEAAYANIGLINLLNGDLERASYNLNKAINLDPDHRIALMNRIRLLVIKGEIGPAIDQINQFIEKYPDDAELKSLLKSIS